MEEFKMTQRELIAIVSRLTFFASDYNYHMAKGNEEKANNALLRLDAVFSMAYDFKENPIKIGGNNGYYAAIGIDLGGGKYYTGWCTSCSIPVDNSTYEEFKNFVESKAKEGYTVYTTNGERFGKMKIA